MIVLNVVYKAKKGMREALYRALDEKARVFRAEEGNICYSYFAACGDEDTLLLLEKWESAEALKAHSQTGTFASLAAIKEAYTDSVTIDRYEC